MLFLLLPLALTSILRGTRGEINVLTDIDCVVRMEAVHECRIDAREHFDEAGGKDDGRPDFQERIFCNWITTSYENCTNFIVGNCFPKDEVNFWIDIDLTNYLDGLEEFYANWDSQKCPPFQKMLERKVQKETDVELGSSECDLAMKNFHECRQMALLELENSHDDGRKDFSERKFCKYETAWLSCPNKLLGVCKTQAEIERMQYWELISDDFEFENWQADKCPVVKEVVTGWNTLKEVLKGSLETKTEASTEDTNVTEEMDLEKECEKIQTCSECEQKLGCGWCSSSEIDLPSRCSTKEHNEATCPLESREKKYTKEPVILKQHTDLTYYMSPRFIQLRPKHVEMGLNVGEIKTLPFTYMFMLNGNTFSHNLPEHIELKIFSNCGSGAQSQVKGCYNIYNGVTVKFNAQFRLKYCPKDASLWKGSYQISNSQGDYGDDDDLHVDFKLFCACSCDKYGTEKVCRNDKKDYTSVNPCAAKDSCTECLRDVSCNWCSGSQYSHPDGSPLPRCNADDFFASSLCPSEKKIDPQRALTSSEDCSSCENTCSGGICTESKKDILESNTCVSQLTCGDCMKLPECAWCSEDGQARCNLYIHFKEEDKNVCKSRLYANQTSCDCEGKCYYSYEKYSPSCNGGVKACGACHECPVGAKGEFCQCTTSPLDKNQRLKEMPHSTIGKVDNLLNNSENTEEKNIGFHHIIPPMGANPGLLRCNSTYCMNPNSRKCHRTGGVRSRDFDFGRVANIFAIYGNARLVPGSELVFKIGYCPLFKFPRKEFQTRFGFGAPVSREQEYSLPRKDVFNDLMQFYTDQAYFWEDKGSDDPFTTASNKETRVTLYGFKAFNSTDYKGREVYRWGHYGPTIAGGTEDHLGWGLPLSTGTEIKLNVYDSEVVWSWEGFHDKTNPNLTEARIPINILERNYYPFFILPGCEEEGQFSAIEIVSSKV